MSGHHEVIDITKEPRQLEALGGTMKTMGLGAAIMFGIIAWIVQWLDPKIGGQGFTYAYLIGLSFVMSISLGGLFFVLVHHAIGAGWGVVIRRLAEGLAMMIPFVGLAMIPILMSDGFNTLYGEWEQKDNPLIAAKGSFLTHKSFVIQVVLFFAIWSGMAWFFYSNSVKQDRTGDLALSAKMKKCSYPCIILYAFSVAMAAFIILMALDPKWFSTIFGVYFFAGAAMVFFAFLGLLMLFLQNHGRLTKAITNEHYHDVGKLTFAFVVFWAYVAYSQYMLIWYANIPEETQWFAMHHDTENNPGWTALSWLLILGHFFVPFLFLLSRHIKRRPRLFRIGCMWVILMQWLDLFWIVMPRVQWASGEAPSLPTLMIMSLALTLGMLGLFVFVLSFVLARASLVPEKDPRLVESLAFENF